MKTRTDEMWNTDEDGSEMLAEYHERIEEPEPWDFFAQFRATWRDLKELVLDESFGSSRWGDPLDEVEYIRCDRCHREELLLIGLWSTEEANVDDARWEVLCPSDTSPHVASIRHCPECRLF